jgi:hypothetical protein
VELLPLFPVLTPCVNLKTDQTLMRKLLLGMALTLPIALTSQASAMPAANPFLRDAAVSVDLIEVKGGHGWGRGHGGYRPFGWSRGRKVGLARPWVPARSLEEGLVLSPTHPLRRSIPRMDQGIGLERDDFLRIVITFGTNALYGRSVDFDNTCGSAAVWVS